MDCDYQTVDTALLRIGYVEWNPSGKRSAVLVHGWPDSPEGWKDVAERMVVVGYRVLCPALRGFGPTSFHNPSTPRSGQLSALGRDLIDFIAALGLKEPLLIGHDWGARAVANAFGLRSNVGSFLVMLSVGYGTNDPQQAISYPQARNYWYHWFMTTPKGQRAIEQDRRAFTRFMWDTWSPTGWYHEESFNEAARAFDNPDWASIVLHSYRHRWGFVPGDPFYEGDEASLSTPPELDVPTLMMHGGADACNDPATSFGKEQFFKGRYKRIILEGIGHFPQREAPEPVAENILHFCSS